MSSSTKLLHSFFPGTTLPFLCAAPMRGVSGSTLTAAAANAGALAFYGAGYSLSDPTVTADLARIHSLLKPGVSWGIGFLLFKESLDLAIQALLTHRPNAVWLFAPKDVAEMQAWVEAIKRHPELGNGKTKVFVQLGSIEELKELFQGGVEPDVVVAQGSGDAGGHGRKKGGSWVTLLPEVKDWLAKNGKSNVPVLAAGGIVDGRGVAGVLAVGGDGAVLGTRLVASEESEVRKGFKDLVVRTADGGQNTIRSHVFDKFRGTDFWPAEYDGRGAINETFTEFHKGEEEKILKERYDKADKEGDWSRITAFMGTGVGLIHDIKPTGEIIKNVRAEAEAILRGLAAISLED